MNKPKNHYNVIVIGSGFSGMAAASILADYGLSILLLDENIHIGGQLLRRVPPKLGEDSSHKPEKIKRIGYDFVDKVKEKKIDLWNQTVLMGVYDNQEILVEKNRKETFSFSCDFLLFATGARERFLPFKGWTLPGVYSTGMLQVLMKTSGVLPAKKMLIAGSGLFLFAAAYEFLKNGGDLQGIMEQSSFSNKIQFLPQVFHQFPKFTEGGRYLAKIYGSRVPIKYRRQVIEARGDNHLEEVVVAKLNRKGSVIQGTEKTHKTQALAVGYGFVPNIEALQLAGCELEYAQEKGGWVVKVTDKMETSVEYILAAGEITGIGGAHKSLNEGKIAASTILEKLGISSEDFTPKKLKKLQKERKHHLSFVRCFNSLYKIKPKSIQEIPDETIICRCESVDMKQIKDAVDMGCEDPNGLKVATRCAMGKCQGRTCAPVITDILQILCQKDPQEIGLFTVRPPFKPISVHALKNFSQS